MKSETMKVTMGILRMPRESSTSTPGPSLNMISSQSQDLIPDVQIHLCKMHIGRQGNSKQPKMKTQETSFSYLKS